MNMKNINTLALSSLIIFSSTSAVAQTKHDHGAHEHGIAGLNLVWEGTHIDIEMESPAFNIVGFEHQPKTTEQEQQIDKIEKILNQPSSLIILSNSSCVVDKVDIDSPFHETNHHDAHQEKDKHDHKEHAKKKHKHDHHGHKEHAEKEHKHDHHDHAKDSSETHSEYHIHYKYDCKTNSAEIKLDLTNLFKALPNMEEVRTQWLSPTQQSSVILTKKDAIIQLK